MANRNRTGGNRPRRGSGSSTGEWALPREYQFDLPALPEPSTNPDNYRKDARRDTRLGYNMYANRIAAQQRMAQNETDRNLERSADVWDRYQKSIRPIGGTLQRANSEIMSQMGDTLGSVYGTVPGAQSGGLAGEVGLGQAAAATQGSGQMGILANAAAAQQGMQAGYQREGAVDATDQARQIIQDNKDRLGELGQQLADYAATMPQQFMARLSELRNQGFSDQAALYQMALQTKGLLNQLASDQAQREYIAEMAAREQARRPRQQPGLEASAVRRGVEQVGPGTNRNGYLQGNLAANPNPWSPYGR